jgi:hypothetical protein
MRFAYSDEGKKNAEEIARRCRHLEAIGAEVNLNNAVWYWDKFENATADTLPATNDNDPSTFKYVLASINPPGIWSTYATREAATALIEACEHLGVLLWPDAETA